MKWIVLLAALSLAGCAANGTLNPTAQAELQNALNLACPIIAQVQTAVDSGQLKKPNANVQSALATAETACPPNPAPTNAVAAVADLIAAYNAAQPLIAKIR